MLSGSDHPALLSFSSERPVQACLGLQYRSEPVSKLVFQTKYPGRRCEEGPVNIIHVTMPMEHNLKRFPKAPINFGNHLLDFVALTHGQYKAVDVTLSVISCYVIY